ncbi:MAG: NAD(+)/NADH kinase [Anaerolineae bacterium]
MQRLGLLYHPYKGRALEYAQQWRDEILARGAPAPLMASAWDEHDVSDICGKVDLIITLGGDGTLLRAVRIGAPCGVPAVGAKLGHVGFLSGFRPEEFPKVIDSLLEGKYWVEERMMVDSHLIRNGAHLGTYQAVNDVVVARGKLARVIRLQITVDGESLDNFAVDGAIMATATGSTAYSLAAGGPILAPTVRTLLLTLISPYLSPIHSLVLPEGARISLKLSTPISAMLTIDGQYDIELEDGDIIETEASHSAARFARLEGHDGFYRTLIRRLREDGTTGH